MKCRMVLMAKSKKGNDGYCIAGIDTKSGEWIRLNSRGMYSIPRHFFKYSDGSEPELLDTLELDIAGKDNREELQPENYYCYLNSMRRVDEDNTHVVYKRLSDDENHETVFYDNDNMVGSDWLKDLDVERYSLIIIEPSKLKFYKNDNGKIVAYFQYKGQDYRNFKVTDLSFINEWDLHERGKSYSPKEAYLLVISLGLPYSRDPGDKEQCWKLIASIIEKPLLEERQAEESYETGADASDETMTMLDKTEDRAELFEELRSLRASIAKEEGLPAYCIFQDKSLVNMCELLPVNEAEFLEVYGVGKRRAAQYGEQFMEIIRKRVGGEEIVPQTDSHRLTEILEVILEGIDPGTGEIIDESVLIEDDDFRFTVTKLFQKYVMAPEDEELVKQGKRARAGESWTLEEDNKLELEYKSGMKVSEIANMHGRTYGAIRARLKKNGLMD